MANTISILSYTNTFGDWFVNTNALAKENNEFGSNNYIKPTGTLYLNDPNLGLQVANSAIIAGQLQVQGIGSSAYVQNNLRVDTQVYFTNTTLGLTNSGQAIIGKDLLVLGSGTGLRVANNTLIGGTLTANGITQLNNDLNVSGNTIISNTVYVRSNTYFANSIVVNKDVWTNNLTTSTVATIGTNLNVINNTYTNALQANASVNTASLTVTGPGFFNTIQSNTRINTSTLTVTGQGILDTVQANTRINTPLLTVEGQGILNTVQANTRINTSTLTVTGYSYTDILIANSSVNTALVNTAVVNTALVQTRTLNVIGTEYVDTINANTLITVPRITLPINGFIDGGASGATISANGMSVGTSGLSVQGNFTINGATVYNAPVFTLSAGNANPALIYNPGIAIYRNTANAIIRWNETNKYWDTLDVINGNYYRILTDEHFSNSTSSSSSTNVATSLAVSSANTQLKAYTDGAISSANTWLKAYTDGANTQLKAYTDGQLSANLAYSNGVNTNQNTRISTVEANTVYLFGALNETNTNIGLANTQLKAYTDGAISSANGNIQSQFGSVYTFATNVYARANTSSNSFVGTTGTAVPSTGVVNFNSGNGVTVSGSGSTLTINTPQDVRTSATPSFSTITSSVITGTSPFTVTSTTLVTNLNAQYLNGQLGSYYTTAGNLSGTIPSGVLGNSSLYVGTTAIALNRGTGNLGLTGITSIAMPGSVSGTLSLQPASAAGTTTITLPATTGTVVTTGDSGTVTSTMIADGTIVNADISASASIAISKLAAYSISGISLGNNLNTLTFGTYLTGTSYNGSTAVTLGTNATNVNTGSTIVARDASGNFSAGTITASLSGNCSGTAYNITQYTVNQSVGTGNNVQHNSLGVGTAASGTAGEIVATNQITAYYSDERLKTKLGNIENALDKVSSLNGFYYEANETAQKLGYIPKREVGVSAQEVQSILPEVIAPAPIDQEYLTVHYERLVPLLIEAIKELKLEIEVLKNK